MKCNRCGIFGFNLWLTLIVAVMVALAVAPASAELRSVDGVPDGFGSLAAPHPTVVTVFYGGDQLGLFPAHFTPSSLQFDRPDQLLDQVPAILDKVKLLALLQQPLPTHPELLCSERRVENCGRLDPEVAGVIFDENRLTTELFINKNELSTVNQDATRYLPLPERHFSSTDALSGAISGSNAATPDFTLSNDNTYSFGEGKIATQSTVSNNGLRFDTASAGIDRMGWNAATGLFRSRAMQLITDRDIGGVTVATSMHTVLDEHKTEGNEIILYLPRRAFVSIYREGRLYSAHDYEAGNQQLDTSELPDGAYNITLKIQEADGNTREETRFFAKSQALPPPDQPVYYAQAGFIRKSAAEDATLPQFTDHPLARLGTVQRLGDNLGFSSSLLGLQDRAAVENGLFWVNPGVMTQLTFLSSTLGDFGAQASVTQTAEKFSSALDIREVWMSDKPMAGYDTLIRNLAQANLTTGYMITPNITFGARGSVSRQSGMADAVTFGPYAEWRIWQEGESSLGLTADLARADSRNEGSILLHFSKRLGNYGVTGSGGGQFGPNSHGPTGDLRAWHDDVTPGNSLLTSAGVTADRTNRVLSGDADWRNDLGQLRGGVQQSLGQGGAVTSYGGNFAIGVAQLADEVHVGGAQNDVSAIIVEISGDADGVMKVFVNGTAQNTVKIGEQQTLFLPPFHIYRIRLAPEHPGLLDYDSSEHKIALYPGNVVKQAWAVNKFYVVSARVKTMDGQPLADAVLQESSSQVATDDKGHVQAELSKPVRLTFEKDGALCMVTLPANVQPVNGVLIYKQPLVCRSVETH